MSSVYQEGQREKAAKLIASRNPVFYGAFGGEVFRGIKRDFVLLDGDKNIYQPILNDVLYYFKSNNIAWWGGSPTGHVLSSQIACINHLYPLRYDKQAILKIAQMVSEDFVEVLKIETDGPISGYIQFEAVSDYNYLNEGKSTRGSNCTSLDALIYAKHKDGTRWLIPIEWKYTEHYANQNKATEGYSKDTINCTGEERKRRYTDLINGSNQLKSQDHNCYYYEPFYQLMRQTLWVEQMVANKEKERTKADNYIHAHVIPKENKDLLNKKYKCSEMGMEQTWRHHLNDQSKYKIITPEDLLSTIDAHKYGGLTSYLKERYWK